MEKDALIDHLATTHKGANDAVTFSDLGALFKVPTDRHVEESAPAATAGAAPAIDYAKLAAEVAKLNAAQATTPAAQ